MRLVTQKRARAVAVLVLIVAGVLAWQLNRGADEPRYQGRSVSSWFQQSCRAGAVFPDLGIVGPRNREEAPRLNQAGKALDALGTNALPYLLSVCFSARQDTWFQTNVQALLARLPKPFRGRPFMPVSLMRAAAEQRVIGLKLPPAALLPSITNYLAGTDPSQRLTVLRLLLGLEGPERRIFSKTPWPVRPAQDAGGVGGVEGAMPWLARSLRSSNSTEQMLALGVIARFGPRLVGMLPDLIQLQAEAFAPTNSSYAGRLCACEKAIGAMGTNAASALPLLKEELAQLVRQAQQAKLTHTGRGEPPVLAGSHRLFLAEVICRIDARELPATLALLEELQKGKEPHDLLQFAASLNRIGPNAKPAIPLLLELADREGLGESDLWQIARALQSLGAEKQTWELPILRALQDQNFMSRINAARRLLQDDPGNATAIQVLIEIVRGGPMKTFITRSPS